MSVYDLRVCDAISPLNAPEEIRFSFKMRKITPASVLVTLFDAQGNRIWRSDYIDARECRGNTVACSYKLQPLTAYSFSVAAKRADGTREESERSPFETGFNGDNSMGGSAWVGMHEGGDSVLLWQDADLPAGAARVRLYVSACGFSKAYINGNQVAPDDMLSPVWSDYHERDMEYAAPAFPIHDHFSYSHYYNAYDVTELARDGVNRLSFLLSGGWYAQDKRIVEGKLCYGKPKLKFCLISFDGDGKELARICSGDETLCEAGPVISTNVYYGETRDAQKGDGMNPHGEGVKCDIFSDFDSVLRPQLCPPDRIRAVLDPKLISSEGGVNLYDKGVNTAGRVAIVTSAPAGSVITMRFAENIKDGALDYTSTGGDGQIQCDTFICDGSKGMRFAPEFCLHGYRYFTVEGDIDSLICEDINTDVRKTFSFRCSDETMNHIVNMYIHAQFSNIHYGIPSDCPHRERLGYTGDGQLTADSAVLLGEMRAFWRKWMRDIADCQCKVSGHVQHTAPYAGGGGGPGAWGGAVVYVPWKMYLHYGDESFLREFYPNMCAWMEYMLSRCTDYIVTREEDGGWCLGDWCNPEEVKITPAFVNSCLFAQQLGIMNRIAQCLGDVHGAKRWAAIAGNVRMAVCSTFYKSGVWDIGTQGAAALAVAAGIGSASSVSHTLTEYESAPIDTGIVATPLLLDALFEAGFGDIAVGLLQRREYPSFGYTDSLGETALCEYYDGSNSHNHPMFGAFVGVLARRMMGICIDEDDPGYGTVRVQPFFTTKLSFAEMTVDTPHGPITSSWRRSEDSKVSLELTIPSDVKLKLRLPQGCACRINRM